MSEIRVAHVINGLHRAGSELMLARLVGSLDKQRFRPLVVCLLPEGEVGREIRGLGIPVETLNVRRGVPDLRAVPRLVSVFRRWRPDIVHTWLPHAAILGSVAALSTPGTRVIWGIRHSNLDAAHNRPLTRAVTRAGALLSRRVPARIVCCATAAADAHRAVGFSKGRMLVIPNSVDVDTFRPDPEARSLLRAELGIPEDSPAIGLVARFDPQKDHRTFCSAIRLVASERPDAHFVLTGLDVDPGNAELVGWLDADLLGRVHLLGQRADVARIDASLDIAVSSSQGEGFPNAIAEALACGVPCVVTDVGDSAMLVGAEGIAVPPRRPDLLAAAILRLVNMAPSERAQLGAQARARIVSNYSIAGVTKRYEELYEEVATGLPPHPTADTSGTTPTVPSGSDYLRLPPL